MNGIITGQYIRGDSVIHRLDPRTKLIGCFTMIVAMTLPDYPITLLLFDLGFIIALICLSRLGIIRVLSGLRFMWTLFLLTFICQALLTGGEPLWSQAGITVTRQGINLGMATFLRLVILFLSASLLTMTTSTLKLATGIESLLSPLTCLRIPVHQVALIINISLGFIPAIIAETDLIRKAQKARGARFDSGPLAIRLRSTTAVLIPLLAASLQRAGDLALAMDSRGYTTDEPNRSRLANLHFTWRDGAAMGVLLLMWVQVFVY